MSLKRRTIPSVLNGVSKQPAILRSADQNEDELNTWSYLSTGLGKRPPFENVAKLGDFGTGSYIHYINRDVTERYAVVITGGQIRVFDVYTGAEKTVNAPDGWGYLAGSSTFRAVTVADYTFIVNAEKTCKMAAAGVDEVNDPSYYLWLNKTTTEQALIDAGLSATGGAYQYNPNPTGGTYAGEVASLTKLPDTAANGTIYKVTGSIETGFVSYYVRRNGAVWDETVKPGENNALDATTMPHALVREADGTFTFAPFSWAPRRVGDKDSNPVPTFTGRTISDIFFYQNRLGLLVDENIILSCAGDFGNYWRNTVLDYVASDVVDVAVTTTNVAILKYAMPFNDGIMAFADQTQFSIENGEQGVSPESMAISPVTRYEMNTAVRPVQAGTEVYFCGNQANHSVVWEYTRLAQGDSLTAAEITAHVPGFIPKDITWMASAPNAKAIFAVASQDIYTYQYYWNGNEKIQSAWRRWETEGDILSIAQMDDQLYALINRVDGVYLERADLSEKAKPADQPYQVYLDRRIDIDGTYDGVNDWTTFTLPYAPEQANFQLIQRETGMPAPGALLDPSQYTWVNSTTVRVPGDFRKVTAGSTYDWRVTFSEQFPLDYQGRPVTTGRLQMRTYTVNYFETGFFRTEVAPYGSAMAPDVIDVVPSLLSQFTGKVVGADTLRLNRPANHTGSYSFQVFGESKQVTITLSNNTHVGSTIVSAEWEGFYWNRASQ